MISNKLKHEIKICFAIIILSLFTIKSNAEIVTNVNYNGKTYYVDVIKSNQGGDATFQVWFRVADNAESLDDIKMISLSAKTENINLVKQAVCRSQDFLDNGKTIVGCGSIIGSAFCAAATVASDGTLAFLCETTWNYTLDKGAADCFEGIADILAKSLGKETEWKILGLAADLHEPELEKAIAKALKYLCEDVKSNGQ